MTSSLPPKVSLWNPAVFIATWGGSGLLPKAPGTWGSLFALPFALIITSFGGSFVLFAASLLAFAVGLWATRNYLKQSETQDPAEVVIDEVAALWLLLSFAPFNVLGWAVGFIVFRFLDIKKIWPIGLVEERFKGEWGVMLDDMAAAAYLVAIFLLTSFLAHMAS